MSHRTRRRSRSRSRDSRHRSYGRSSYSSYGRSRSFSKPRRASSRDRRSISRNGGRNSERNGSTSYSDKKHASGDRSKEHNGRNNVAPKGSSWQHSRKTTIYNDREPMSRYNNAYRRRRMPRQRGSYTPRLLYGANKYESEDFRSQRLQKMEPGQQEVLSARYERKDMMRELSELTAQLNSLVAELSSLPKDSAEREEISNRIQRVKDLMKEAQNRKSATPGQKKLLLKELPEDANLPGKLAAWIASNSAILQPKQIAMLGHTAEGAVVEYKTAAIADTVYRSCQLHGITVSWANSEGESREDVQMRPAASNDVISDVDYNLL
ncbi:uncharacterized protein BBOV_IV003920 [Babesia bovis T2Bo]|uniref:uncharacterized protein n=1 Tax=Babesia bovis T2Bo TaxID=484906 RepID=UPI001DA17B24|nr:uncharacterized protein BBOV_IV003920 [Babesia bovis T2Bo]EDO06753.2 hypothetical protein BBOV_IV003920 [Babesia bovis T2Bo]